MKNIVPKFDHWVQMLEAEWSKPNRFLAKAREGIFDERQANDFVALLQSIKLDADNFQIPKRFVSLVWYIPVFLHWQKDRVAEKGGSVGAFERLINRVQTISEDILGVP